MVQPFRLPYQAKGRRVGAVCEACGADDDSVHVVGEPDDAAWLCVGCAGLDRSRRAPRALAFPTEDGQPCDAAGRPVTLADLDSRISGLHFDGEG